MKSVDLYGNRRRLEQLETSTARLIALEANWNSCHWAKVIRVTPREKPELNLSLTWWMTRAVYLCFRDPRQERRIKASSLRRLSLLINLGVLCLLLCYDTAVVFFFFFSIYYVSKLRSTVLPSDGEGHNYHEKLTFPWVEIRSLGRVSSDTNRPYFLFLLYIFLRQLSRIRCLMCKRWKFAHKSALTTALTNASGI